MSAREIDLERLRAELKIWHAEMAHLEQKLVAPATQGGLGTGGLDRAKLEAQLAILRQLSDKADMAVHELASADEGDWGIQREGAKKALLHLGGAFEQLRSRFRE